MLLITPEIQRSPSACGPAALAAVLRFWGIHVSQEELAAQLATDEYGTSLDAMSAVAFEMGLIATTHSGLTLEHAKAILAAGVPIIAECQSEGESHWRVITGIGPEMVEIMDPNQGNTRMPLADWDLDREGAALAIGR